MFVNSYFVRLWAAILAVVVCGVLFQHVAQSQEAGLDEALEAAVKAAVAKVAPCVVQIQTVGGQEFVGSGREAVQRGLGPTTGLIVASDGWILSSSFNFANRPTAITVSLPGQRQPAVAKVVAQDRTRQITLLKVDAGGLPTPTIAPRHEIKLGQWAIAVGRTLGPSPSSPPSVSLGIVSALDRIWGKAIQTDCKVSPVNYGGPLIDLQGRVLGLLVPLSPRGEDETAGVEWYDSGIGFAVPLEDLLERLPALQAGRDLLPGRLGVRFKDGDDPLGGLEIESVLPSTTAALAGARPGDVVIAINGRTTATQGQLRHILGRLYAGDVVRITVQRGAEKQELAATPLLPPPRSQLAASLGVLPMRDDPGPGIAIRHVFTGGPADQAGLRVGDRLLAVEGQPLTLPLARRLLSAMAPGEKLELAVRRGDGKTETIKVTLGQLSADLPAADLPSGSAGKARVAQDAPPIKAGLEKKLDAVQGRSWWVYVPENARPGVTFGLLIWLHRPGEPMTDTFLQAWKDLAARHYLIIYAPQAENPNTWLTSEINPMLADVRELLSRLPIDRQRIVAHGLGAGATLAHFLASDAPQLIRGVVAVNGPLPATVKDPRAEQRLLTLIVNGKLDPDLSQWRTVRPTLVEKGYPVLEIEIDGLGNGYPLAPERLAEIARWIDAVDRL